MLLGGQLDVLILATVFDEPAHRHVILQRLKSRSGGAFDLSEETIRAALDRLERDGLLASERSIEGGRCDRMYEVTRTGQASLVQGRRQPTMSSGPVRAAL
jgi:PadR family transcriptional regulator, regulatory protein PadR